eukprot:1780234-Amphidinium_carterae.1
MKSVLHVINLWLTRAVTMVCKEVSSNCASCGVPGLGRYVSHQAHLVRRWRKAWAVCDERGAEPVRWCMSKSHHEHCPTEDCRAKQFYNGTRNRLDDFVRDNHRIVVEMAFLVHWGLSRSAHASLMRQRQFQLLNSSTRFRKPGLAMC